MNTKNHTDIKPYSWIGRLPAPLRPYALLARLDRPVGIWLLLLPGWWAITLASGGVWGMNLEDWRVFGLFGLGAVVMRSAGCVINDLWDRKFDRAVERTSSRPLASGALNPKQAIIFLVLLLCGGLAILLQMNVMTVLLGFLSVPLIVLYPLMKRWTWWPQAFLGLTFNFGALMGWAAVTGIVEFPALLLYAGGIFWTLGYDTIYAHQDKEDDILVGVRSTALKFGEDSSQYVTVFYVAAWLCLAAVCWLVEPDIIDFIFLILAGLNLYRQVLAWDMRDPASSLKIFKSNSVFGGLVLLALVF